jgi:hypothetical protein
MNYAGELDAPVLFPLALTVDLRILKTKNGES